MIIVEGPDGAGKTTLVNELSDRMGLAIGERSRDRDHLYESTVMDSYGAVMAALIGTEDPIIWDRLFYSDPIYAHIVRDERSQFSDSQYKYLHACVCAMNAPVIICLPDLEEVKRNVFGEGHQLEGVADNIEAIFTRYHNLLHVIPGHQLILYDYTVKGSIPRITERLEHYLEHRREREVSYA